MVFPAPLGPNKPRTSPVSSSKETGEYKQISPLIEEDVYHDLQSEVAVERRNSLGGTGFKQIKQNIDRAKQLWQA